MADLDKAGPHAGLLAFAEHDFHGDLMRVKGVAGFDSQLALIRHRVQKYGHPKYGLVVTKWPRKRGPHTTPAAIANAKQFKQVVGWCRSPMAADVEAAQAGTAGTGYLVRDAIESACYGLLVIATLSDGRILYGGRMVGQSGQALLDSITQDIGTILVRTADGWIGLEADLAGKVLTCNGILTPPTWQEPTAPPGPSSSYLIAQPLGQPSTKDTNAAAFKGSTVVPNITLVISDIWAMLTLNAGARYKPVLITLSNGGNTPTATAVILGPEITISTAAAWNWLKLPFSAPVRLIAGGNYAIGVLETDGSGVTPCPLWYPSGYACGPIWEGVTYFYIQGTQNPPIVGSAFTTDGGERWPYLIGWNWAPST